MDKLCVLCLEPFTSGIHNTRVKCGLCDLRICFPNHHENGYRNEKGNWFCSQKCVMNYFINNLVKYEKYIIGSVKFNEIDNILIEQYNFHITISLYDHLYDYIIYDLIDIVLSFLVE